MSRRSNSITHGAVNTRRVITGAGSAHARVQGMGFRWVILGAALFCFSPVFGEELARNAQSCEVARDCKGALPRVCKPCPPGQAGACAHWACIQHRCEIRTCDRAVLPPPSPQVSPSASQTPSAGASAGAAPASASAASGERLGGGAEDLLKSGRAPSRKKARASTECRNAAGELVRDGDPGYSSCTRDQPPQGLVRAQSVGGYSSGQAGVKLHF